MKAKCPICGKNSQADRLAGAEQKRGRYFPFCSERCQLLDLNSWFESDYKISRPLQDDELDGDGVCC